MKVLKSLLIANIALFIFAYGAIAQDFTINTTSSSVKWKGEKVVMGGHNGKIQIKSGNLKIDDNLLKGEFLLDMTSIVCDDLKDDKKSHDKLIGHLKSDDFFSVEKHPTSKLVIKKGEKIKPKKGDKSNYMITADLTIKGKTNEITFPAWVNVNSNNINAKSSITIDRSKWDVRYGSGSFFDNLGDKAIKDDIKFEVNLKGNK